ncbi:MAG: sigma-70 family RNA polymerase sigma factor [Planctomycetes bacterium]|nr:sigma-70 family RNA polymerase sigma factor [Planctomycetota bacterium]MCB9935304.1 sigma-70 family RNA polymerase sigma factor [Planctomycetota bacterium]
MELETEQQTDDALVARFRRGDRDAFAKLYQRHRHGLYGYALSFYGQEAPAADAVQALWLDFLADVDSLAGVANVRAYLYRSLRNRVLDEFRSRKREANALAQNPPVTLVRPRDTVTSREDAEKLNEALMRLPEEQREVVLLRIYGEMKFADIADVLQASTKTVESRHRLALEKLREWLQPNP